MQITKDHAHFKLLSSVDSNTNPAINGPFYNFGSVYPLHPSIFIAVPNHSICSGIVPNDPPFAICLNR